MPQVDWTAEPVCYFNTAKVKSATYVDVRVEAVGVEAGEVRCRVKMETIHATYKRVSGQHPWTAPVRICIPSWQTQAHKLTADKQ